MPEIPFSVLVVMAICVVGIIVTGAMIYFNIKW